MDKNDPSPRDTRDLLLELTACLESVKALTLCVAEQLDMRRIAANYDGAAQAFHARVQGESHPDRYLELAEEHFRRTRAGLQALIDTAK
ncbi:MAG: hypothetical protein ACN6O2_11840 [Stenotrophomonas sp.]